MHNLHIETGRYTQPKTPADLRKCIYCNDDAVEDEIHLLLNCTLYIPERLELLNNIKSQISHYDEMTDVTKFTSIMKITNPESIRALGKYIYKCLDKCMNYNKN